MKKFFYSFGLMISIILVGYVLIEYYSYIFAKHVDGRVYRVERVTDPTMIVGSAAVNPSVMHSFAVAVITKEGKIFTASSEDRQWAVAQRGLCVETKFYPYPFWDLKNSGTYFNARLLSMNPCPPGTFQMDKDMYDSAPENMSPDTGN